CQMLCSSPGASAPRLSEGKRSTALSNPTCASSQSSIRTSCARKGSSSIGTPPQGTQIEAATLYSATVRTNRLEGGTRMWRVVLASLAVAAATTTSAQPAPVTFTKDVLPILQQHCQSCHRPGQIAPMSLITYEDARPWAKAIKAAVTQKKMPPWF